MRENSLDRLRCGHKPTDSSCERIQTMSFKGSERDCPVCLGIHDELIHAATVNLHTWWRQSLLNRLVQPEPEAEPAIVD